MLLGESNGLEQCAIFNDMIIVDWADLDFGFNGRIIDRNCSRDRGRDCRNVACLVDGGAAGAGAGVCTVHVDVVV